MSGMCSPEGPRRIEGYTAKTRGRISNTSVTQHSVVGTDASCLYTTGYGGPVGGELGMKERTATADSQGPGRFIYSQCPEPELDIRKDQNPN